MNCRDFLAEFEERRALSETARLHLNDCRGCKKTSGEQTRLWQMIDGLQRIDAPNDFDFRVKAKIADSKPASFQSRFLPVLRYVLPLSLVVLVVGLLAFNTSFFFGGNAEPQVVETVVPMPEREIAPVNSFSSNQVAAVDPNDVTSPSNIADADVEPTQNNNQGKQYVAVKFPPKSRINTPRKKVKDDFVGFRDIGSSKPEDKFPLGINPNQRPIKTSPNADNPNSVTDEEIWSVFGLKITRENGSRTVKTVQKNSSAERSGIEVGDVIEAIDGVKLAAEPIRAKQIQIKKLTVARGAEKIEITLKN